MVALIDVIICIPALNLLVSIIIERKIRSRIGSRLLHIINLISVSIAIIVSIIGMAKLEDVSSLNSDFIEGIQIDWLAVIFLLFVFTILFVVLLYSYYYFKPIDYITIVSMIWGMYIGIVTVIVSINLVLVFLGWEVMVIAGYFMVIFNRNEKSLEAGLKYLVLSTFGSMMMLFSITLLLGQLDSLNYEDLVIVSNNFWGKISIILLICGIGVTAGIIFLNQWLPDAHSSAPTPVSAILSGVLVKLGIYLIYRVINPLNGSDHISLIVVLIGMITITEGNIMVYAQFYRNDIIDVKRIFAYSTTVHLGFLFLVISQYTTNSHLALVYHIINHGIAKTVLFLLIGYLYKVYQSKDLRALKGKLHKDNKLTMALFISLFSLGGFPGTGGFISKLLILITMYNGLTVSLVWKVLILSIILINTLLGFIGYLMLVKWLVFDPDENVTIPSSEYNVLKYPIYMLSIFIIWLGIMPKFFLKEIMEIIR